MKTLFCEALDGNDTLVLSWRIDPTLDNPVDWEYVTQQAIDAGEPDQEFGYLVGMPLLTWWVAQ